MKAQYFKLAAFFMAATMSVGLFSCKDDDNSEIIDDPTTPIDATDPNGKNAMADSVQMNYLEEVALELIQSVPASDFQALRDYVYGCAEMLKDKKYDATSVLAWGKAAVDSMTQVLSTTEGETVYSGDKVLNMIYSKSTTLAVLSNFTGHFTLKDTVWTYEKANDLQFIFTDFEGKNCVLKLAGEGKVKNVHIIDEGHSRQKYLGLNEENQYVYQVVEDSNRIVLGIPEKVKLSYTQAGVKLLNAAFTYELDKIENEEFNIAKSNLTNSGVFELYNGYKFEVTKLVYKANQNAALGLRLSKNDNLLISLGLTAGFSNVADTYLSEIVETKDKFFEATSGATFENVNVKLNVLNKVQMQCTVYDLYKFLTANSSFRHIDGYNKEETKAATKILCENMDCGLFYDGSNVKQADIRMGTFPNADSTVWAVYPVIKFGNDISYALISDYFNVENFSKVVEAFGVMVQEYKALVKKEEVVR